MNPSQKQKSDLEKANILSRLNFFFVFPLVIKGWRKRNGQNILASEDFLSFPDSLRTENTESKMSKNLSDQQHKNPHKKINTAFALLKALKGMIFLAITVQLIFCF